MKQLISMTTAVVMLILLATAPAHADRKTREGFMLGVGAAVLGSMIYQGLNHPYGHREPYRHAGPPAYERGPQCQDNRWHAQRPAGYWGIKKVWVEPVYETRRHPGHPKNKGKWNSGRHERYMVRDGHWKEVRVWVRY